MLQGLLEFCRDFCFVSIGCWLLRTPKRRIQFVPEGFQKIHGSTCSKTPKIKKKWKSQFWKMFHHSRSVSCIAVKKWGQYLHDLGSLKTKAWIFLKQATPPKKFLKCMGEIHRPRADIRPGAETGIIGVKKPPPHPPPLLQLQPPSFATL